MSTTHAMRPFEGTMPLAEARAIIDQAIVPIERTESIRVLDENGLGTITRSTPTRAPTTRCDLRRPGHVPVRIIARELLINSGYP